MSCRNAVYQWTEVVTTHLPHLSKPRAGVLALWSLGMVLARSCALTAVSLGLSGGLGAEGQHGTATVTGVVLRSASEAWEATSRASGGELFCAIGGLGAELGGGAATGLGCGCDDLGPTLCGLGGEHTVSGLCH